MSKSSPSRFGVIAIFSTFAIVVLIVGLVAVSFMVRPEEPEPVETINKPIVAVSPEDIDPALAIAQLGGISAQDVVGQASEKDRPGTGLAAIIYSPEVSARDAAGDLLLVADNFIASGDVDNASLSYQLAGTLATLSPDLSDGLRADIFMQAGYGLGKIDQPVLAKIYLDQAYLVATESKYLQPAYRTSVLKQVGDAYQDIGLKEEARKSLEASLTPANLETLSESPLALPVGQDIPLPMDVQEAEKARWQAAQRVVRELVERGGEVTPESIDELRQALLKEDEVKTAFFAEALIAEQQLSGKLNLTQAKIIWQSIKYRLAKQGFGVSIVPEWEDQLIQLEIDLATSYQDLYRLYDEIIVAMPDASQIDRATEEALRRQILVGELGQYPNYPADQLKDTLLTATAKLVNTQPGTKLRVSYLSVNGEPYFVLISDEAILNQ